MKFWMKKSNANLITCSAVINFQKKLITFLGNKMRAKVQNNRIEEINHRTNQ